MKFCMLGFRVVTHISMLPVRGAHASSSFVFRFGFDCNVPPRVIPMNL